ncbi:unnamed protein product, partial [Cyprideis torosa]
MFDCFQCQHFAAVGFVLVALGPHLPIHIEVAAETEEINFVLSDTKNGPSPPAVKIKETWGYEEVRTDAFLFWWLYFRDASAKGRRPLVIWLQGGPGGSSCGFGNFEEIGPLDVNRKPRNNSWVKDVDVLFVDNPVGAGFSYVRNGAPYARNNDEIARDLLVLLTQFFKKFPNFSASPLYIFGESYGGKMVVGLSKVLHQAVKAKKIKCNFKGIALGDSWISPMASMQGWPVFLYESSRLDEAGLINVTSWVKKTRGTIDAGDWVKATKLWDQTEGIVQDLTGGIDWYNILKDTGDSCGSCWRDSLFLKLYKVLHSDPLSKLMNGPIRRKLGIIPANVTWAEDVKAVFDALDGDFMKSVVCDVDWLLNKTDLTVAVYNGQMDLIVPTVGTMAWVSHLTWPGATVLLTKVKRKAIREDNGNILGFVKKYKDFSFYWILNAGHMVPSDAPYASRVMLNAITHPEKLHDWRNLEWAPPATASAAMSDQEGVHERSHTSVPIIAVGDEEGQIKKYGLYSAMSGGFVYCILGSVPEMSVGPTAIMSLLTRTQIQAHTNRPAFAVLLTFLNGLIILLFGVLHLGFLIDFISAPVISAFVSAAAITIASSQLSSLLGIKFQKRPRGLPETYLRLFQNIKEIQLGDALMGIICIIVLTLLRTLKDINKPVPPQPVSPAAHVISNVDLVGETEVAETPVVRRPSQQSVRQRRRLRLGKGVRRLLWLISVSRNAVVVIAVALVAYVFLKTSGESPFSLTDKVAGGLPAVGIPDFTPVDGNVTYSFFEVVADFGSGLV